MSPGYAQFLVAETFFDIPEQPLDSALEAYMRVTGLQGFYKSTSTKSFTSNAVRGRFTPGQALDMLLVGTNLTARHPVDGAFTVVALPTGQGAPSQASPPGSRISDYTSFLGTVQGRIIASLCQNSVTRPGSYRAALQLSVGPSGVIDDALLLDTTGNVERDRGIVNMLRGMTIGEVPSATMPQPITMLIKPQRLGLSDDCRDRLSSFDNGRN